MATTQDRIGHQVLAVLDVVLRVPCIFIIDAIFNSYYDTGSGWPGAIGKFLFRITGKIQKHEHAFVKQQSDWQIDPVDLPL